MAKTKLPTWASLSIHHNDHDYPVRVHAVGDAHLVLVGGGFGPPLACCGWRAGKVVEMPPGFRGSWPRGLKRAVVDALKRMEGNDA